jgi:hypothetical protein
MDHVHVHGVAAIMIRFRGLLLLGLVLATGLAWAESPSLQAKQTLIREFKEWGNRWTGPHWNFHAPMVVVEGDLVVASTSDTDEACTGALDGATWRLFWRKNGIWRSSAPEVRQCQREPCPIARVGPGRFVLFSNPTGEQGRGLPELRVYRLDPQHGPQFEQRLPLPIPLTAKVTSYTYRGLATDPNTGAFLVALLDQSNASEPMLWFYGTLQHGFERSGMVKFPDRACYPYLVLTSGRAAMIAVQDVVESNEEWRKRKLKATGNEWDYVFRRLYLTTSLDLVREGFRPPRVIEDVSRTGGYLQVMDVVFDDHGLLQVLYMRQQTTSLLRKLMFPAVPDKCFVEFRSLDMDGNVTWQTTLPDPSEEDVLSWGRLFTSPGGETTLFASSKSLVGGSQVRNWLLTLQPNLGTYRPLALSPSIDLFHVANARGGNVPSMVIEADGPPGFQGLLYGVSVRAR